MRNSVKEITAVAPSYPDGQKLDTLIIEYRSEIGKESVDESKFCVRDRTIEAAYTTSRPERGEAAENGKYVVIELSLKDRRAKIINMSERSEKRPEVKAPPRGVPELPQQIRREIKEVVCQREAVKSADGTDILPWEAESEKVIQPVIDTFRQFSFEGISYNLFIPKTEEGKRYPLVVFIHDAGANGSDPFLTLAQGNGATGFAGTGDQNGRPAFVLAPQIPKEVYLTSDEFICSGEIETVKRMIDDVAGRYPVDGKRIVYAGQSQGCMAGCELNVRYPGYFAASLLVAGQWTPETVGRVCCHQKLWIFVSDGDRKAYPGMTAVTDALERNGAKVKRYHWNAKWPSEQLEQAAEAAKKDNCNVRFTVFEDHSVISAGKEDTPGANHMGTWQVVFDITAIRNWLLSQEAEERDPKVLGMTGEDYLHGNNGRAQDFQKCFEYSKEAAQLGNVRSYTVLGILYRDGSYVIKDVRQAMEYFKYAAAGGDFKAPRFLGLLFEEPEEGEPDYGKAFSWYQMAAEKGDITGKFLLGRLYERGLGVERDYKRAMELYLDSASRGDVVAAPALEAAARLYREGLGVPQDDKKAEEWQVKFEKAKSTRLH